MTVSVDWRRISVLLLHTSNHPATLTSSPVNSTRPLAMVQRTVLISYPDSQYYVKHSLINCFNLFNKDWSIVTTAPLLDTGTAPPPDLQWSDYDHINWHHLDLPHHLINSYTIRKSLIRKNHLSHTLALHLSKHPNSTLHDSFLTTFYFNLSFPDELDELLQDDLYLLAISFDSTTKENKKWWILKPALADKGMGIRLFSTRRELERIFEEFQDSNSEEEEEEDEGEEEETGGAGGGYEGTRVSSSQLQEWVIQEYVSRPLLLDPSPSTSTPPSAKKFHLRVYVLAVGGLKVYINSPFLALFAPTPYSLPNHSYPSSDEDEDDDNDDIKIDLSSHLTNTCLQGDSQQEIAVRSFQSMSSFTILSGPFKGQELGDQARIQKVEERVGEVIAETFRAGIGSGSGFQVSLPCPSLFDISWFLLTMYSQKNQVLPNCFEIFGVDILLDEEFNVFLLEINAVRQKPLFTIISTQKN